MEKNINLINSYLTKIKKEYSTLDIKKFYRKNYIWINKNLEKIYA